MGLKESLGKLKSDEKLSVKREVKKELTKIKNDSKKSKRCMMCNGSAGYSIKGSNDFYCKDCALEMFSDLGSLKKI